MEEKLQAKQHSWKGSTLETDTDLEEGAKMTLKKAEMPRRAHWAMSKQTRQGKQKLCAAAIDWFTKWQSKAVSIKGKVERSLWQGLQSTRSQQVKEKLS